MSCLNRVLSVFICLIMIVQSLAWCQFSPTGTSMYDSAINQDVIFATAGSFVEMLGDRGDVFQVGILVTK